MASYHSLPTTLRQPRSTLGLFMAVVVTLVLATGITGCQSSATDREAEPLDVQVATASGTVEGLRLAATEEGDPDVLVFKGIPYAAPPVGELRWRDPQPVAAWDGTREAKAFSPACWQPLPDPDSFYGPGPDERDEDCLYLNVWTAARRADEGRPVMVWIHGGGLVTGGGQIWAYDGSSLAKRGVVLVTINYRLGPFGFLAHPALSAEHDPPSSGEYGILDQIAALRWVRENIARFGGDPERVTIFGESAGSWSVCYLMASPLAKGLFQRAIGESGGVLDPMPTLANAEEQGERFAEQLEVAAEGGAAAMRAKSAEEILDAFASNNERGVSYRPAVDGWAYPTDIHTLFAEGRQNDVPLIVGSNGNEGTTLFRSGAPHTVADYRTFLDRSYGDLADEFASLYPAATDSDAEAAFLDVMADQFFAWQMRTWARLADRTGASPAYLYAFTHVPPIEESDVYGSFHAAEIVYVFDNLDREPAGGRRKAEYGETDRQLASAISSYWVNFASTGDPNGTDGAGDPLPAWPTYDAASDHALELGDEIEVLTGFKKEKLDLFDRHFDALRATS